MGTVERALRFPLWFGPLTTHEVPVCLRRGHSRDRAHNRELSRAYGLGCGEPELTSAVIERHGKPRQEVDPEESIDSQGRGVDVGDADRQLLDHRFSHRQSLAHDEGDGRSWPSALVNVFVGVSAVGLRSNRRAIAGVRRVWDAPVSRRSVTGS